MPAIRIENGPQAGAIFPIGKERITIGRDETATIRVLDAGVSRDHAEIFRVGGMCFVKDLDSRNGTYVGEEPVAEELLQYGDRIRVGSTVLVFEEDVSAPGLRDEGPPDVGGTTVEVSLDAPPGAEPRVLDRRLETLFRLAGAVVAARGVDVLAQDALAAVVESLAPDAAFVYLKDEETGRLSVRASFERDPDVRTPLSRTLVQRVLRERKAVLTTDLGRDDRFRASESAVANVGQSILCTPLGSSGGLVGVLYLQTGEGTRPYGPPDLELASTLGIVVGTALQAHFARAREHRLLIEAARALGAIREAVEPGAPAHAERVYTYAAAAAKELGLSRKAAVQAELAALLHDVGKGLPGSEGDGPPEPARHAVQGAAFVARIAAFAPAAPGIRHHHERWDGAGLPEGLSGEAIPQAARIVAVADFFDHRTASRETGGEGLDVKSALGRLGEETGKAFDREVVEAVRAAYQRGELFAPRPCLEEGLDEP